MIRLSKLADYAILLLAQFPGDGVLSNEQVTSFEAGRTARELAEASGLPMPTVSKVMKVLGRRGLVRSQRGASGGYALARPAKNISVVDIITAIEGPIGMTACTTPTRAACDIEADCPVKGHWQRINAKVIGALADLNLMDMQSPSHHAAGEL